MRVVTIYTSQYYCAVTKENQLLPGGQINEHDWYYILSLITDLISKKSDSLKIEFQAKLPLK